LTIPVKLPKEVLNLFPTWEYRCLSCGTYVESNTSFCPKCKTAFDEKRWRVPPRFLKSREAMSEYAHKVLAPKLTPKQRELVFQYFTELFSDGFESGDFSAWTGTSGSPSITTDPVHHGTYAMQVDAAYEYVKKILSEQSIIYYRFYFRITALSSMEIALVTTGSSTIGTLQILSGGNIRYTYRNGSSTEYLPSYGGYAANLQTNTWYCLEIKHTIDGSNGEVQFWLDKTSCGSASGLDTDNYGNVTQVILGRYYGSGTCTVTADCVVVADTYIGPEEEGATYTKTWQTDTLFKKLGITRTFGADSAFKKHDITKSLATDAAFQKSFITQKLVDAFFKRSDILKSFAVDVRFGALMTYTTSKQIDALLKKLNLTKNFGLDTCFGSVEAETYAKTFGLSAIFAYRVRLPELWLDETGKIVLNVSRPYTWVGT